MKLFALGLAASALFLGGSAQAATTTATFELGISPAGTQIAPGGLGGLVTWIGLEKGTLPVGSILRSIAIDAKLEANVDIGNGLSWASDLCIYFDPTPDTPGDDGVLLVGDDYWDPDYETLMGPGGTKVGWANGQNDVIGTPVIDTKTAGPDFPATIDLNAAGVFLENGWDDATWSGTITVEYDVPAPATIVAFGLPGNPAVIDQDAKTIAWTMPYGTVLTNLAPEYTLSSGTCDPASGSTQDFTSPVTYTVIDGTTVNPYTVTATLSGGMNVSTYDTSQGTTFLNPIANLLAETPSGTGLQTANIKYTTFAGVLPGITDDNTFSVIWDGWLDVLKGGYGDYTFGTASDDGSVVYVDLNNDGVFDPATELVVDNNQDQGTTIKTGTVTLNMNLVHVLIGYYQNLGGLSMEARFAKGTDVVWGSMQNVIGAGLTPVVPTTTLTITRPNGSGSFTISGTTGPGLTVHLWKSLDLSLGAAGWTDAGSTNADTAGAFSFPLNQGSVPRAFYQVKP